MFPIFSAPGKQYRLAAVLFGSSNNVRNINSNHTVLQFTMIRYTIYIYIYTYIMLQYSIV